MEQKFSLPRLAPVNRKEVSFDWGKFEELHQEISTRYADGWTEEKVEAVERFFRWQDRMKKILNV